MLQKVFVRPKTSRPQGPAVDHVSPLDQYMTRSILPMLCFFQVEPADLRTKVLDNLKTGLACTLDEMPFLAANIIPESEERDTIQLEYDSDAGVWFYSQDLPEFNFQTLASRNFSLSDLPATQFVPEPRFHHPKKTPALTVLVTFITGGVIVTANGHHSLVDAHGCNILIETLAKNVAAASEGRTIPQNQRLPAEALDRTKFRASSNLPPPEYPASCTTEERPTEAEVQEKSVEFTVSKWFLPDQALHSLKAITRETFINEPEATRNTLMAALVWRHVSLAQQLSSIEIATSLITPINMRRRMPEAAWEYPGNCVVMAKATVTAADVLSHEDKELETLYNLARQISESISWWTAERVGELIASINSCSNVRDQIAPPSSAMNAGIFVTKLPKRSEVLPVSGWGLELGPMKAFRVFPPPMRAGMVEIVPDVHGGLLILLWIREEVHNRLKEDNGWTKWVKLIE